MLLLPLIAACGPDADDTGADTAPPPAPPCTDCVLTDANNYHLSATLDIASVPLQPQADATVSWAGLTTNIREEAIDPYTTVQQAMLVGFDNLSPDEVEVLLATDQLDMTGLTLAVMCTPTDASCRFSDFNLAGNYMDPQTYFTEGRATWLVVLSTGGLSGVQAFSFVEARADSTATLAEIDDGSATLAVDLDLQSLAPIRVTPGADLTLDWSGLTTDGLGNELSVYKLDRIMLGHYASTLEEMEARVWELETGADALWQAELDASSVALADLEGETPFTGVTADGTWLVALYCSTCTHPAPRVVTVLEVVE